MKKFLIGIFVAAFLLLNGKAGSAFDSDLYTFCVGHWTADGLGATFFKLARDSHCTLDKAVQIQKMGHDFFPGLPQDVGRAPVLCTIYIESNLAGFTGNQPLCPGE